MKINIIIPSFNRGNVINKTLDSIMAQTYQDWDCFVIDDNSNDNTREVVEMYSARDSRIKYLLNERKKGAQGARNTGLYKCRAEWVFFFDSDNQLLPDCLEELVAGIKDDVDVVQCFSRVVNAETGEVEKYFKWRNYGDIEDKLYTGETYVDFNHAIIRKSKVLEIGGLDEDCPSMQEWDTHLRLSKKARYNTIEKVLVDYYVGAQDAISTDNKKAIKGRLYNLEKYLDKWKQHKIGYYRFISIYSNMIDSTQNGPFKEENVKKLDSLVEHRRFYAFMGSIINKWFGLKRRLKK